MIDFLVSLLMIRPVGRGPDLPESAVVFTILWNGPNPPDRTEMSSEPPMDTNKHKLLLNFKRPQLEWERLVL